MTDLPDVFADRHPTDPCTCGHPAVDHTPCCGACLVCGITVCAKFEVDS